MHETRKSIIKTAADESNKPEINKPETDTTAPNRPETHEPETHRPETHRPETFDLTSMDVGAEKRAALRGLFPEVFAEDRIDFDQLKRVLGTWVEPGKERFGLTWPGKADCMRVIQQPSIATLKPARDQSVDFDTTGHLFIEGDNLEVLKLLQKAYFGKVKMIYIDPPYNTGKEFIYPDKHAENLRTYLEYTGQLDGQGRKFSTNTEQTGRYHSNWLSMMYPRLYLARNLLREDGVIFISIDDNEQAHLKALCDQIFGEENFVGIIIWKKKTNGNNMGEIPSVHDYFICYAKNLLVTNLIGFPISEEYIRKNYSNTDNDPRGPWTTTDLSANHKGPYFEIINPNTNDCFLPPKGRYWVFGKEEVKKRIKDGRIIFGKSNTGRPVQKKYLSEKISMRVKPESWWDNHGMNEDGTTEISELFEPKFFDHPKPTITLKHLCNITTQNTDLILDFFSGSSSTAHAVMQLNAEDGGQRKYICVQLPEPCDEKSEACKAGYDTIADIGRERIRRAAQKIADQTISSEQTGKLDLDTGEKPDLGFRAFRLDRSNFKVWDQKADDAETIAQRLEDHIDHLDATSTPEDILYELLLKAGFELTTPVTQRTLAGKPVFSIEGETGPLLICLEKTITTELIDALAAANPAQVICLDAGFRGNDQLKANAVQSFKTQARITSQDIIFQTV